MYISPPMMSTNFICI